MSVIAVKVDKNKIYVAADSILLRDDLKRTNFKKIFRCSNMIVGGCGECEELSLMFLFAADHELKGTTVKDVVHYMHCFADWKHNYNRSDVVDNTYIIVSKGHAFEVEGMFVREILDYTAIGDGEPYALAALHLGHTPAEAVKCACALCNAVAEPVVEYTETKVYTSV